MAAITQVHRWWIDPARHDETPPEGSDGGQQDPPPDGGTPPADGGQQDPPGGEEKELPDNVKAILDKERKARRDAEREAKANKTAADKLARIEEENKTEQQKTLERAEKAEARAKDLEVGMLRRDIAAEKNIPADLIQFLTGDDREAIEAAAEILAKHIPAKGGTPGTPGQQAGSAGVGTRGNPPAPKDMREASKDELAAEAAKLGIRLRS